MSKKDVKCKMPEFCK